MRFSCYSLQAVQKDPSVIYTLGDRVLGEIATVFKFELPTVPTAAALRSMIDCIAPHKTLQDNIKFAKEQLGADAFEIATAWLQRTGAMTALHGSFCDPTVAAPQQVDTVVWSGGMANWMQRRMGLTLRLDPEAVGRILLPMGTRTMAVTEHPLVRTYSREYEGLPTETSYTDRFIVEALAAAGFKSVELIPVDSDNSSEILAELFRVHPDLLEAEHETLVVGNAPNMIQAAGQFRLAARRASDTYDARGGQLFMMGDTFPIGVDGQPTWQAQNPVSGIGQLLRNFAVLLQNAESPV